MSLPLGDRRDRRPRLRSAGIVQTSDTQSANEGTIAIAVTFYNDFARSGGIAKFMTDSI